MGLCAKLKFSRRQLGLSQRAFADKVGLSVGTIAKLEIDESAWSSMRSETVDKIYAVFEGTNVWASKPNELRQEISDDDCVENVDECFETVDEPPTKIERVLNSRDSKTLILIEFAYEGLVQAETHEEFEANINLLKRVLKKY